MAGRLLSSDRLCKNRRLDLLFWFHYTQALKRIIFKDQYIPALKYRELELPQPSSKRKSANEKAETSMGLSRDPRKNMRSGSGKA